MDWVKLAEIIGYIASGGSLTIITGFILKYRRQSWKQYQEDKETYFHREQEEETSALSEYKSLFGRLKKELEAMRVEIEELRQEHLKCREESVELRGTIRLLEFKLSRLEPPTKDSAGS